MMWNFVNSKIFKMIYGIVLPIITIIILMGFASLNTHRRINIFGSSTSDLVVRLIVSIWFSGLYIRLSRFSTFKVYPNKKWSKEDVGKVEKYYLIGQSFLFCLGIGFLTYWIMRWFFPNIYGFTFVVAITNGLIVFLPMATQYWILKL